MAQLVHALAADARADAALDALIEGLEIHPEALLLGATTRAADDLVRQAELPAGGLLGVHRANLARLAADLSALPMARRGHTRLTGFGAEALAARAAGRARARGPLEHYEPVADTPGFPRALARTLGELRLAQLAVHQLEGRGPAGRDLARLLEAFEAELEAQALADYAAVLEVATEAAEAGPHRLLEHPVVLLDVAPRHAAERALVAALARRSPAVFATAHSRDRAGLDALSRALGVPAKALEEPDEGRALDRVRRYVFSSEAPTPNADADPSLTFFSAPGEARECVEIARRIRALAAEQDIGFDQVAVLLRSPGTYQPLLEDAFARADVDAFFTRGARRPDPAGRALLALLACAAEGLTASRFAEYLSLGQVPRLDDSGAPRPAPVPWVVPKDERQLVFATLVAPPPAAEPEPPPERAEAVPGHLEVPLAWEKLLLDAAVIGGKDRWQRRLEGLRAEVRRQVAALEAEGGARLARKQKDLLALENLQRFALPVVTFLDGLPESATWRVWLDHLEQLATLALRAPEPVLRVLAELRPMGEVGPVGLAEVQVVLTDRLSFLREEPEGARYSKVFVGTLDEAAGRSFEVVFVPGLAEGVLPQKIFEDPLLLDEARAEASPALATRADRLEEERLRLHLGLGAARSRLMLSYPRVDVMQGRPRVPSFYALDLLRAAEGSVPGLTELKRRAAEAADARLGWPAPADPSAAIDETEYDLSVLGARYHGSDEDLAGRGHYLVAEAAANGVAAIGVRNLRAQAARWRKAWSRADGFVATPDRASERAEAEAARALLAPHRPSRRAYSPTALQNYAACPLRFYLQGILHLRPREVPEALEALDPLTRGSLFHQVQFVLFGRLEQAGLLPVTPERLDAALERLDEVFELEAKKAADELAPAIPAVWDKEVGALLLDLRGWLRDVAAHHADWAPIRAELAFGLPKDPEGHDAHSTAKPVKILGAYQVRGSIDLVERHTARAAVRVTDHKTGRAPKEYPTYVGKGEALQPLIYGLAARELVEGAVETGRLYFCTQRGGFEAVEIPVDDVGERHLAQVFETIEAAVEQGFLPAAPHEKACQWCDVRLACAPGEPLRLRRKDEARLVPLSTLRSSP